MPLPKSEQDWNYYANVYKQGNSYSYAEKKSNRYAQKPENFTATNNLGKKVNATRRRKLNGRGVLIVLALIFLQIFLVAPTFIKKVAKPIIFQQKNNKAIKSDNYNFIVRPTSKYLYNINFLNTKMLVGTSRKPLMTPLVTTKRLTNLENTLKSELSQYNKLQAAIYVWDAQTGNYADINGEQTYPAASIIKIPVLISLFKAIEAGKFPIDDSMKMEDPYISSGSGGLQYISNSQSLSVDRLARLMITDSDNTATNMLMSKIGSMSAVNSDIKSWGIKNTYVQTWLPDLDGTNYTSPKDLAVMLSNLDNEDFLSVNSRAYIFDYMGHVKNNRLLAAGIPSNASIAHKTGDIGYALGDAGIVYTANGKKYIIAIMVKRPYNDSSAKDFIVKASQTVYDYIANN